MLPDKYTVILKKKTQKWDITELCSDLTWGSSEETLSEQLTFSMYGKSVHAEEGDIVTLKNNGKSVSVNVVTDSVQKKDTMFEIVVNDFGWYLNKNKFLIQFKKLSISNCIIALCNKAGIEIGSIPSMPKVINKIYSSKSVSEILNELLDINYRENGRRIRYEMSNGKLDIFYMTDKKISPKFIISENYKPVDSLLYMGDDWSISKSLSEMINKVLVVISNKKSGEKVLDSFEDKDLQKKYGTFVEIVEAQDEKDIASAKNEARTILKDNANVGEEVSITLLVTGDDVKAGRSIVLPLNNQLYRIKSVSHAYSGGSLKKSQLTLGRLLK